VYAAASGPKLPFARRWPFRTAARQTGLSLRPQISAQVNSQFADFVAVHCFPFKGHFQFIHRSQQPLGSAINLG
jgi:hypothetical protein